MKVVLYAVDRGAMWEPRYSATWEVDEAYWLCPAFRAGAGIGGSVAKRVLRMEAAIPLGAAEAACSKWTRSMEAGSDVRAVIESARAALGARKAAFKEIVTVRSGETKEESFRRGRSLAEAARQAGARLSGRSLLREEAMQCLAPLRLDPTETLSVWQMASLMGMLRIKAAVAPQDKVEPLGGLDKLRTVIGRFVVGAGQDSAKFACRRCGSGEEKLGASDCAACGTVCRYCEACLTMGRCRECEPLVIGYSPAFFRASGMPPGADAVRERWGLSPAQGDAAAEALSFLHRRWQAPRERAEFLLWAVTGAGKTEMIFPLLDAVLARGGRALVATPRRDVVLELAPRLARAFAEYSRAVLYGGSAERWEDASLTLATTHQAIRFQEAFDLVLIDELDAFPYHNDPMLRFAAAKSRKKTGATVYLSATPPADMQRDAKKRRIACARVPVRYHRKPLPVPERLRLPTVAKSLRRERLAERLLKRLALSVGRGAQAFVFVPHVGQTQPLVRMLRECAPKLGIAPEAIEGTSSRDKDREAKVARFRDREIRLLVTTTILERGVTIPKSDVFVLDADNPLFDSASLVQMSGRAGRSADDPYGSVIFGASSYTASQRGAIRQIRAMNRLARKSGYLT